MVGDNVKRGLDVGKIGERMASVTWFLLRLW